MKPMRLALLGPGPAEADGLFATRPAGVYPKVYVYAPVDAGLAAFVGAVAGFNSRAERPTDWHLDVRGGADWVARFFHELPGSVAIFPATPGGSVEMIRRAVVGGLHVFAAGPWVGAADDLPRAEAVFADAEFRDLVCGRPAPDRFDPRLGFVRALFRNPGVAAGPKPGGRGLELAGPRPADVAVGLLAAEEAVDYHRDITADAGGTKFRGVELHLAAGPSLVLNWNGAKADVRFGGDEVVVTPRSPAALAGVLTAVRAVAEDWRPELPGIVAEPVGQIVHVSLPPAPPPAVMFSRAFAAFLRTVQFPRSAPAWERSHVLAAEYLAAKVLG